MVHVRFEGRSLDICDEDLDLKPGMSDAEVKARIASRMDVSADRLRDYVVDRVPNGNLILRPVAVYG